MRANSFSLVAKVLVACLWMGIGPAAAQDTSRNTEREATWSKPVNGLQARIVLKRFEVFNGTPIMATYLHLRNASDVMNPLTIPWDTKLIKFHVVDAKGKQILNRSFEYDGPMLDGTVNLVLPVRGELSFDYSSHGLGIPPDNGAAIDLGPDACWIIEPNQGDCFLRSTLEVPGSGPLRGGMTRSWHGRIELPPVKIPVGTEPIDKATAEAKIKELAPKMLEDNGRASEDARRALSLINDPAVIPWYVKALDSNSYDLKFCALDKLSRFNSDKALAALKRGVATQATDVAHNANANVTPTLAQNIRGSAAQGLARSPHPDAKRFLLSLWNNPDRNVRLEVVHVLGRMDTPESLALLEKMSGDDDELVRSEAKRYLKLRNDKDRDEPNDGAH